MQAKCQQSIKEDFGVRCELCGGDTYWSAIYDRYICLRCGRTAKNIW